MTSIADNGTMSTASSASPAPAADMPQWKRDLIMRRRAQQAAQASSVNKQLDRVDGVGDVCAVCRDGGGVVSGGGATVALGCRPPLGHQPTGASTIASGKSGARACCSTSSVASQPHRPTTCCADMVHLHTDSDSSEELQYGPGIVSKLKNRYLSLTLREAAIKRRPSILRKSTSLENLLDDDVYAGEKLGQAQEDEKPAARLYESRTNGTNGNAKNVPSSNRYRGAATRGSMKRARSVEAISRIYSPKLDPADQQQPQPLTNGRPKSLHEEHLNGTFAINPIITPRVNKPKRLTPVITEREKPPADVVKQAKKIFESRPETRTRPPQQTGEVAAKVATYKNIIIQTKQANTITSKPPIKQKPVLEDTPLANIAQRKKPTKLNLKSSNNTSPLSSPSTPNGNLLSPASNGSSPSPMLSPLGPVITPKGLQSPIPDVSMVKEEEDKKTSSLSETPDLILHSSPLHVQKDKEEQPEKFDREKDKEETKALKSPTADAIEIEMEMKKLTLSSPSQPSQPGPLSPTSKTEPLTLDITAYKTPTNVNNRDPVLVLSPREIEKNAINAACNGAVINGSLPPLPAAAPPIVPRAKDPESPVIATTPPQQPPKAKARKSKQQAQEANCIVFKFTDRKDVPDYIGNDGRVRTQNVPMPKAGESGITLLPGTTIHDVFDEAELGLDLEGPPSPCDVQFINDNVLIDGKSSLSKKSKKSKLRIQFVEAIPQVFEYPSEASLLKDDAPALNQPLGGTTVPSLSGSTLANYTPKAAANEFQLGVTKTPPPPITADSLGPDDEDVIEHDTPIRFSSGTNADILF